MVAVDENQVNDSNKVQSINHSYSIVDTTEPRTL